MGMARKGKHGTMADGVMAWLSRPEGPIEPVKTNWTVTPANDNLAQDDCAGFHTDKVREITPSISEIRSEMTKRPVRGSPITIADGTVVDGPIVAIGKLQFSDGAQKERGYTHGPDGKLVMYDAPMPLGAMLYSRERLTGDKGPSRAAGIAPARLADMLGVQHSPHKPGGRNRGGTSLTAEESAVELAKAYANTAKIPQVKICPPGIANGNADPSSAFVGMRKDGCGSGGAMSWEDVSSMLAMREMWLEAEAALMDDAKALDASLKAKTLREVGESHGFMGKRAERMGKRILAAANDNVIATLKKVAA